MAATGNMSLIRQMGDVMLQEARALSNYATDHNLGPFSRGAGLFYWCAPLLCLLPHFSVL